MHGETFKFVLLPAYGDSVG